MEYMPYTILSHFVLAAEVKGFLFQIAKYVIPSPTRSLQKYILALIDTCTQRHKVRSVFVIQKAIIEREEDNIKVNLADQFRDAALEELDSMLDECTTLYEAVSYITYLFVHRCTCVLVNCD